ncbi:hypothetical protein DPSP01_001142 [Paraphaeosphaeria sporulosa]
MGKSLSVNVESKKRDGDRRVWPRQTSAAAKSATDDARSSNPTALGGGYFGKDKPKVYAAGGEWGGSVA